METKGNAIEIWRCDNGNLWISRGSNKIWILKVSTSQMGYNGIPPISSDLFISDALANSDGRFSCMANAIANSNAQHSEIYF
jgi:hypothetical protein